MAIDEPWNCAVPRDVDHARHRSQRRRQFERIGAHPQNAPAADEQMLSAERLRRVQVGVAKEE
jgi:hypothetical protein